jgi:hypothetical protein
MKVVREERLLQIGVGEQAWVNRLADGAKTQGFRDILPCSFSLWEHASPMAGYARMRETPTIKDIPKPSPQPSPKGRGRKASLPTTQKCEAS